MLCHFYNVFLQIASRAPQKPHLIAPQTPHLIADEWQHETDCTVSQNETIQDGPSLESSSYLNLSLRYLGPWDPGP